MEQSQAVMLLTVSFGKANSASSRPLSTNEWARFAVWLKNHELEPASLLKGSLDDLLAGWKDRMITIPRIRFLLGRGAALGLALEKWHRAGLWVLTRSSPEYPERLKRHLHVTSPPVLFGCGNKALLNSGGIAVIGSRDASHDDLAFAADLGSEAASQGFSIVSGGARGIDQSAMQGALDKEGTVVGVLGDSLLKSATSSRYRKHIMSRDLVLVSPFNPEAGFNVGNAMARNRYIYCLSDTAVVVCSAKNKGGTWSGAIEGIKNSWVPLWINPSKDPDSGNTELGRQGAKSLPGNLQNLSVLFDGAGSASPLPEQGDPPSASSVQPEDADVSSANGVTPSEATVAEKARCDVPEHARTPKRDDADLYSLFVALVADVLSGGPISPDKIASGLNLQKSQANAWLKRATEEGVLEKLSRPVRYQLPSDHQTSLFRNLQ